MFEAKVFLAGPSRQSPLETGFQWNEWSPFSPPEPLKGPRFVYIADAGIESFLKWFDGLKPEAAARIQSVVWCGDGDSLGKHGQEILKNTAARLEGRWREHFYSTDKDFSDCAAITSLIEYDIRHAADWADLLWLTVHGALGGRADHELANLYEFSGMLSRVTCPAAVLLGPERIISTTPLTLNMKKDTRFSLLSAFGNQQIRVRVSGARYSGEFLLRQPSHGISNRVTGDQVIVEPLTVGLPLIGMIT